MSVSRTFLRRIQKSVSGTVLCKKILVVVPTKHILRGFCFQGTRRKSTFSFYQVVMPLYTYRDHLYLSYSEDLTKTKRVHLVTEEIDTISEQVLKMVDESLPHLRSIRGPKEFLEWNSWMVSADRYHITIDLALTHFMLGDAQLCLKILEDLTVGSSLEPDRDGNENLKPFIHELRTEPSMAAQRIHAWERANIERFGLIDSMVHVE